MQEVYYGVFSGIKAVEGREGSRNGQRKKFSVYPTGNFILGVAPSWGKETKP